MEGNLFLEVTRKIVQYRHCEVVHYVGSRAKNKVFSASEKPQRKNGASVPWDEKEYFGTPLRSRAIP